MVVVVVVVIVVLVVVVVVVIIIVIVVVEVVHPSSEIRNSMGWASYSSFLRKTQETLETEILSSRVSYFGGIVFTPET